MSAALLVLTVREAGRILECASTVDGNLTGWNACQFTLLFDGQLIVDMVFSG